MPEHRVLYRPEPKRRRTVQDTLELALMLDQTVMAEKIPLEELQKAVEIVISLHKDRNNEFK